MFGYMELLKNLIILLMNFSFSSFSIALKASIEYTNVFSCTTYYFSLYLIKWEKQLEISGIDVFKNSLLSIKGLWGNTKYIIN